MGELTVDVTDVVAFAHEMALAAEPNITRELGVALRTSAKPIAATAASLAPSLSGSATQIGPTVRVVGGVTKIAVKAGFEGRSEPPAKAFEGPGPFRHPVFGNRNVWVSQAPKPYLRPAIEQHKAAVALAADEAVFRVLYEAGFTGR